MYCPLVANWKTRWSIKLCSSHRGSSTYLFLISYFMPNNRSIFGPLPKSYCYFKMALRDMYYLEMLMHLNAIVLAQYGFVFWLKNPMAFEHEFWCRFIKVSMRLGLVLIKLTDKFVNRETNINYCVCAGVDPSTELYSDSRWEIKYWALCTGSWQTKLNFQCCSLHRSGHGVAPDQTLDQKDHYWLLSKVVWKDKKLRKSWGGWPLFN